MDLKRVPVGPAKHINQNRRNTLTALCFLLPNIVGFLLFTAIPIVASFIISLYDWPLLGEKTFVGLQNYIKLFTKDPVFPKVLTNTIVYVVLYVSFNVVLAMALAVWLTGKLKGTKFYRSLFFIPQVTPIVATAMIWKFLFLPDYGLINSFLGLFGIQDIPWLSSSKTAMAAVIIMSLWQGFGYNMIIFISGLLGVPASLKEAARIDGASSLRVFFKISLPMTSPSIFFAVVMTIISSFQVFDQTLTMTGGGPNNATATIVLYLYDNAFQFLKLGYASSMAWVLFAAIMIFTIIQMRLQKDVVHYE